MNRRWRGAAAVAVALLLTGCSRTPTVLDTTLTRTSTAAPPPAPSFSPPPARSVAPLPPGRGPAPGEVERACPYLPSAQQDGPGSMADLEGDRIYRTTVLTGTNPVGCRFYFWASPFEAVAEISTRRFDTPLQAHNAMVLTAEAGTAAQGYPNLVPGVDAVSYRTAFFGPDGQADWACVFAKGTVMVTVRTQRTDSSQNARDIARAIAGKF